MTTKLQGHIHLPNTEACAHTHTHGYKATMPQDHKQPAKTTTRNGTLPFYNTTRFEITSTGTDT